MAAFDRIAEEKAALRRKMRQLRGALPKDMAARDSEAICRTILSSVQYGDAQRVLAYMPIQNEVSLLPVIRQALSDGKQVYLPAVSGKEMWFYRVWNLEALRAGAFSIPEPEKNEPFDETDVALFAATLVLVPGVAFTRRGARLGYGGGYYDRFLARFSGVVWAAAYECQLVERLPQEAADKYVCAVITQRACYERNDHEG